MTLYIVRAKPKSQLSELRKEMDSGKISNLKPFGKSLQRGLENARMDKETGYAMWVEERLLLSTVDKGTRESVLDRYFDDITVDRVKFEREGRDRISNKPYLWNK
jgi:hypothetical protein